MQNNKVRLEPESTYHIYNRANGSEKLFLSDENYRYFLKKYEAYLYPIVDTLCYCLLPNHFHFLIRVKKEAILKEFFNLQGFKSLEDLILQQFSNFFNGYAKAFNKQQNRKGSLFMHPFKRKQVTDITYLRKLIHYIHYNPVNHGFCNAAYNWKHSSYSVIISGTKTTLEREEVIGYFEELENFMYCHQYPSGMTGID
jgi:putative transposase